MIWLGTSERRHISLSTEKPNHDNVMITIMSTVFPYDNIANSSISDKCLKCQSLHFFNMNLSSLRSLFIRMRRSPKSLTLQGLGYCVKVKVTLGLIE